MRARMVLTAAFVAVLVGGCASCARTPAGESGGDGGGTAKDSGTIVPATDAQDANVVDVVDSASDALAAWREFPTTSNCGVYVAEPSAVATLPKLVFADCGNGCAAADYAPLGETALVSPPAGSSGDPMLLQIHTATAAREQHLVVSATTGSPVAAFQITRNLEECGVALSTLSPLLLNLASPTLQPGVFDSTGALVWKQSAGISSSIVNAAAVFDSGILYALSSGSVTMIPNPSSTTMTTIDPSGGPFRIAARGDLAVWSVASAGLAQQVRGSFNGTAATTLVAQDGWTLAPALSATRLVWPLAHGTKVQDGLYDSVELYWSPRPASASDVVVNKAVSLPMQVGYRDLQTWGDWAAVTASTSSGAQALEIVRLTDGKLWSVPPRSGHDWLAALGINDTYVVVAESDSGASSRTPRRIVRLELSKLDAIEVK